MDPPDDGARASVGPPPGPRPGQIGRHLMTEHFAPDDNPASAWAAGVTAGNKEIVRRYHERLWRDGDLTAIDEYWSPLAAVRISGFDENAIDALHADVTR